MKRYLAFTLVTSLLVSTTVLANTDANSSASNSGSWSEPTVTTPTVTKPTVTTPTVTTPSRPTYNKPVVVNPVDAGKIDNPEGYELYTVKQDDNLSAIAYKYGTTWNEIAKLNGITNRANMILPGEVFFIPGTQGTVVTSEIDDVVTTEDVVEETFGVYTVVSGDNLSKIADKYDTTWSALARLNGLRAPYVIHPGDELRVPGEVEVTTPEVITPEVDPVPERPTDPELITPEVDPVDPEVIEPVDPSQPVITYNDGVYIGINSDYSTEEANDNWDYFVGVSVNDGEITEIYWDAKNESVVNEIGESSTKKVESKEGRYGMVDASSIGKTWAEQAEVVEDAFMEHKTLDIFEVDPETNKLVTINGVDATSSVTIKVDGFMKYANEALEKAQGNLPATSTVDTLSSASLTVDGNTLVDALDEDGTWLVAAIGDTIVNQPINVDGTFHKKNDDTQDVYRKLTPSNHVYDAAGERDKTKEEFYILTALDGMNVTSPNLNLVNGTFVGDIYVDAEGFTLSNMTVFGNIRFSSIEAQESSTFTNSNVIGTVTYDNPVLD
ncbi:MAG: LysM peptidoglycan-binding domain-containing protein [Lachnospirales bacterium]